VVAAASQVVARQIGLVPRKAAQTADAIAA
jgi:hypothetical protein